jgi:hypothetical protein
MLKLIIGNLLEGFKWRRCYSYENESAVLHIPERLRQCQESPVGSKLISLFDFGHLIEVREDRCTQ